MQHNKGREVAIIGGGIGGLTAAIAFARTGADVTVYEQAAALTEVGAGVQITPNGIRVLNNFMLENALKATGLAAQAVVPTDGLTGQIVTRFDLSDQQAGYHFFHRAALIDLLARTCDACGVVVKLDACIDGIAADGSFRSGGQLVSPDVTVGADGLKSRIREQLNAPDTPFFTGQVAWRALIKQGDVPPEARIWMLPGRHVVTYPLSNGRLNIVAVEQRKDWTAEGWHHTDDPANLRAAFADGADELQQVLATVEHVHLWGLFRHPVAQNWFGGSVAILGDAAHPTLPFLAQGANLAIEDAYVLARCCDEHLTVDAALPAYQNLRRARVVRAIKAANRNAVNYHLKGIRRQVSHAALHIIGRTKPAAFLNRLSWLYDHDVTA